MSPRLEVNLKWGTRFTVEAQLSYKFQSFNLNDCTLKWIETTNVQIPNGPPANIPTDMLGFAPDNAIWNSWNFRRRPCGKAETTSILDTPLLDWGGLGFPQRDATLAV